MSLYKPGSNDEYASQLPKSVTALATEATKLAVQKAGGKMEDVTPTVQAAAVTEVMNREAQRLFGSQG